MPRQNRIFVGADLRVRPDECAHIGAPLQALPDTDAHIRGGVFHVYNRLGRGERVFDQEM